MSSRREASFATTLPFNLRLPFSQVELVNLKLRSVSARSVILSKPNDSLNSRLGKKVLTFGGSGTGSDEDSVRGWDRPPPALDDGMIQWVNANSTNGKPFRIGWKKTQDATSRDSAKGVKARKMFNKSVYWSLSDDSWKELGSGFYSDTGISRYNLHKSRSWVYDHVLEVTFDMDYFYKFCDQTRDCYSLSGMRAGDHYIQYNSKSPNIVRVRND